MREYSRTKFFGTLLAVLTGVLVWGTNAAIADPTAAGTIIITQASTSFIDQYGNAYTTQSNTITIEVQPVYSFSVESEPDKLGAIGQSNVAWLQLTNTGNIEQTYDVALFDSGEGVTTFGVDKILNGQLDSTDPQKTAIDFNTSIATPDYFELTLLPGESLEAVATSSIPNVIGNDQDLRWYITPRDESDNVEGVAAWTSSNGYSHTTGQPASALTDLGAGQGTVATGLSTMLRTVITAVDAAVLTNRLTSSLDSSNGQITYTVTVQNIGSQSAQSVSIFGGRPNPENSTGINQQTTVLAGSITSSGFGGGSDIAPSASSLTESGLAQDLNADSDVTDDTEAAIGLDIDFSGAQDASALDGIFAFKNALLPGGSVSLSYTVETADLWGGTAVENQFWLSYDRDGNASIDELKASNLTEEKVPKNYASSLSDIPGATASPAVNDGEDDDGTSDDTSTVDVIAVAGQPKFGLQFAVTAPLNISSAFELVVDNNVAACTANFPAGTAFSFEMTDGTPITDSNADGNPDIWVEIPASNWVGTATVDFYVVASLPSNSVAGTNGYCASVFATSSEDSTVTDMATIRLAAIAAGGVDIGDVLDTNPNVDQAALTPTQSGARFGIVGFPGSTQTTSVFVHNDGASPDSFTISSGGSWLSGVLGNLPEGFNVTFADTSNNPITATPLLDSGEGFEIVVNVTYPTDMVFASENYEYATSPVDGGKLSWSNPFGVPPFDRIIVVRVVSSVTGAADQLLFRAAVNSVEDVSVSADNLGQLKAGGSLDFVHVVENLGNTVENITLTSSVNNANWAALVRVDTDGDGNVDTALENLDDNSSTVYVTDVDGNLVSKTMSAGEIELGVAESLNVEAKLYAPTDAAQGNVVQHVLTASYNSGTLQSFATDTVTVVDTVLVIEKTAALDSDCDGTADSDFSNNLFDVNPGQCAIYQSVVRNAGQEDVEAVVFKDPLPAFSSRSGDISACMGDAGMSAVMNCTVSAYTDVIGDDAGDFDDPLSLSNGWVVETAEGFASPDGRLGAGESMSFRYGVQVE